MSIPPQYTTTRSVSENVEDCRDFLRTGRCKYGGSCKYNHPANVQSGGGMKTPLDPTEPLFPVRPNEAVCQYYLKHGTCKFAQACKFNHPPQMTQHAMLNGGTVLMVNVGRQHDSPQMVMNPVASELQFLPQRPDEPDCIYFLKNGRCKYGATCRYHHPLNYHQRRLEEQRRHHEQLRRNHVQLQDRYQPVHYVTQPVASLPQGQIYVAENSGALVNSDGNGTQSYRPFSVITGADGVSSYCVPVGSTVGTTEQGSSTSSIASSFDTAHDHMALHGDGVNPLWNQRNGSVNSLNVHNDARGQTRMLAHSASEGNIARRSRTSSHGSASDYNTYYDASGASIRRNGSAGSWQLDQGSPFEYTNTIHTHPYGQRSASMEAKSGDMRGQVQRSRPPGLNSAQARRNPPRRGPRAREGDEGFTMMTSALLNMLDTPEEPAENFNDDDLLQPLASYPPGLAHEVDPAMFERLSIYPLPQGGGYVPRADSFDPSSSPTWQGASPGREMDSNAHVMQMMHPRQQREPTRESPHPHDPNVGLYLP
jgi:hypothetical protein